MKKRSIILIAFVFLTIVSKSQVTLEETYSATSDTSITFSLYQVNNNLYSSDITGYILLDSRDNSLKFYNTDYSLNTNISISPPNGFVFSSLQLASKKLFNDNENVEFMVFYSNSNNTIEYRGILYDETGSILHDFGNIYTAYAYIVGSNYKLTTNRYPIVYTNYPSEYHYEFNTQIFLLDGIVPNNIMNKNIQEVSNPYPNPANDIINLPYSLNKGKVSSMKIFNSNGLIIEQKQIDSYFNRIMLNVSNYTSGVYFYEYEGKTNSFIVE